MRFMLLINQGTAPLPGTEEWDALSEEERKQIAADYQEVNRAPGVTPAVARMEGPEAATTVRVENGKTLTTDGPFTETKEALGGYLIYESDSLEDAVELASKIPAARMGGAIEIRPFRER
jgi:hypothetical protein